jgi:hypothetical protein
MFSFIIGLFIGSILGITFTSILVMTRYDSKYLSPKNIAVSLGSKVSQEDKYQGVSQQEI